VPTPETKETATEARERALQPPKRSSRITAWAVCFRWLMWDGSWWPGESRFFSAHKRERRPDEGGPTPTFCRYEKCAPGPGRAPVELREPWRIKAILGAAAAASLPLRVKSQARPGPKLRRPDRTRLADPGGLDDAFLAKPTLITMAGCPVSMEVPLPSFVECLAPPYDPGSAVVKDGRGPSFEQTAKVRPPRFQLPPPPCLVARHHVKWE